MTPTPPSVESGAPTVPAAARALVEKLEAIHQDPRFESVWLVAHDRIGPYDGPTYTDELASLKAALERLSAPAAAPPTGSERDAWLCRALASLRSIQMAAGAALEKLTEDAPSYEMFASLHREAVRGLLASEGVTNQDAGSEP